MLAAVRVSWPAPLCPLRGPDASGTRVPYGYLTRCYGQCTGLHCIDSTPLVVCYHQCRARHRVFAGIALRGQISAASRLGINEKEG